MDEAQFHAEVMAELEQEEHKRQGYAEHMAEIADIQRKESKENGY